MRKLLISLVLAVFLIVISVYLLRTLNPFDTEATREIISAEKIRTVTDFSFLVQELMSKGLIWDYINLRNFLLVTGSISAAYISLFTFIHLILDKLFFRKFYQQASLSMALRRGVLSALAIVGALVTQMYGFELYVAGLWVLLLLIIEVLTWKFFQPEVDPTVSQDKSTFKQGIGILADRLAKLKRRIHFKVDKTSSQNPENGELRIENEDNPD